MVDQHTGPFLRQLRNLPGSKPSTAKSDPASSGGSCSDDNPGQGGSSMLAALLARLQELQALGWVDRVVLAAPDGSSDVQVRTGCHTVWPEAGVESRSLALVA